jgi:ATP synthase subunit 6
MIFSPLEQFSIVSLLPIKLGGMFISFSNSSFLGILVCFFLLMFLQAGVFGATFKPSGWQSLGEFLYDFVLSLVEQNISKDGLPFFPMIFTVFCFILFSNLLGLIPYSFTVTSHLIVTFGLAFALFFGINVLGIAKHGFNFLSLFLPGGAPLMLAPFLVVIELISYVFRVISLSVRLFANMMAGHALLKILAGFAWTMFMFPGLAFLSHLVPMGVVVAIYGLEFAVAFLQAYVFTTLFCMYTNDCLHLH